MMDNKEMDEIVSAHFQSGMRACATLSVFNMFGRLKLNYNYSRGGPSTLGSIELWIDGQPAMVMPAEKIQSVDEGTKQGGLDFTMKSGEVINIR